MAGLNVPPTAPGRVAPGAAAPRRVAVVIPALNEARRLPLLLADLAPARPLVGRPLVVDGGSSDGTALLAQLAGARVIRSRPGRGEQLRCGAEAALECLGTGAAGAGWLLFLHADARLVPGWRGALAGALARPPAPWCFRLRIEGAGLGLRLVEAAVAVRSRWGHRPYGDQGLLIPADLYRRVGGYRPLPLMEDLDLVERLAAIAPVRCLPADLQVDGRRWRRLGVAGTAWRNHRLRRAWRRGVSAEQLAASYYGEYQKAQRRRIGSSSQPWLA